jgi:hypothetical protein
VVDRASAVLGLKNKVVVPIDGNHRTMCRFASPNEPRFQPVIQNLRSIVHEVLHKNQPKNHDTGAEILELVRPDLMRNKERNPPSVPGTCTWLLRNSIYKDWLNQGKSHLLWISADPGCGKSVMASYLTDIKLGLGNQPNNDLYYIFFK